jgi:hypothetical protein
LCKTGTCLLFGLLIFVFLPTNYTILAIFLHHFHSQNRYYDDSACVLRKMLLDAKAPHLSSAIPPTLPWKVNEPVQPSEGLTRQGSGIIGRFGQSEELRCVIAIIRQYVISFPLVFLLHLRFSNLPSYLCFMWSVVIELPNRR